MTEPQSDKYENLLQALAAYVATAVGDAAAPDSFLMGYAEIGRRQSCGGGREGGYMG